MIQRLYGIDPVTGRVRDRVDAALTKSRPRVVESAGATTRHPLVEGLRIRLVRICGHRLQIGNVLLDHRR